MQNPGEDDAVVDFTFMASEGLKDGPQDVSVPGGTRLSIKVNDYYIGWGVSTLVTSGAVGVVCERAMFDSDRIWGHDSVGCAPLSGV